MTDAAPLSRAELRVQLLLQLPDLAARGFASSDPEGVIYTDLDKPISPDVDYDPEALAGWILEQFDLVQRQAVLEAATGVDALEADQAEMIELATAGATFSAMAEWTRYLTQVAAVLRRGLSIKECHDLAATLDQESARAQGVLVALTGRFPALRALLGEEVGKRSQGLVSASGVPLEQ